MDQEEEPTKPAPKKSKKKKHQSATQPAQPLPASNEFFAYHPEDEVIEKVISSVSLKAQVDVFVLLTVCDLCMRFRL